MYDPEKITYFAETDTRNKRVPFGIKAKDRQRHMYVIGKTGMGKSTLMSNMAVQDIQSGEGLCMVDPHGSLADLLLEYIPPERVKDVVYFAPFDIDNPISFNVMEDVGPDKRHLVVTGLMSAFKKLFGEESFSDRMQYILQNTILALLEYPGSTMLGINRMLTDKDYREKVVANVTDTSVKAYWTQEFANYTERFAAEATPAIQNKIGQFTSNPLVRNIIGQPKSTFDIRQIMDEGKIMIVNLSKGRVGEANANLLGAMLITKIYLAAMSRADRSASELAGLPNFYLYVDEFQNFANESFADILSEARKYKLNLMVAHQYIEQMSEEVRAAVFGNVGTTIAFRVGAFDAEVLEKEFAPVFTAEDMVNLGFAQIYLKLMIDGIGSQPFSATTLGPLKKPETSLVQEVIAASRQAFSSPRQVIEKNIADWYAEGLREQVKAPSKKDYMSRRQSDARGGERREPAFDRRAPKPIDFRGKREEKKEETHIKREAMHDLPADDFKPLSAIKPVEAKPAHPAASIHEIQKKKNNQREPSPQNVNDLRSALAHLVKEPVKQKGEMPKPVTPPKTEMPKPETKPAEAPRAEAKLEPKKQEVSPDMLKSVLGIE